MWLVAGLGNPGAKYSRSRHNVGFMVIEELSLKRGFPMKESPERLEAVTTVGTEKTVFIQPITYMNSSGMAVVAAAKKHGIKTEDLPEKLIVIYDDIDMETGRLKIKKGGSSGGHRGVESIIEHLGAGDFVRIKIGIGRDNDIPPEVYVLKKFGKAELKTVRDSVIAASEAVLMIITEGLQKTMNTFNKRPSA